MKRPSVIHGRKMRHADLMMIDRADFAHETELSTGLHGEDVRTWEAFVEDIPCRYIEEAAETMMSAWGEEPITTTIRLLVPTDASRRLLADMRVTEVRLADGTAQGPFVIDSVLRRRGVTTAFDTLMLREIGINDGT